MLLCIFSTGGVPPSRWIVNFDYDLMDGLVIAALLGAHMPFLVCLIVFLSFLYLFYILICSHYVSFTLSIFSVLYFCYTTPNADESMLKFGMPQDSVLCPVLFTM